MRFTNHQTVKNMRKNQTAFRRFLKYNYALINCRIGKSLIYARFVPGFVLFSA